MVWAGSLGPFYTGHTTDTRLDQTTQWRPSLSSDATIQLWLVFSRIKTHISILQVDLKVIIQSQHIHGSSPEKGSNSLLGEEHTNIVFNRSMNIFIFRLRTYSWIATILEFQIARMEDDPEDFQRPLLPQPKPVKNSGLLDGDTFGREEQSHSSHCCTFWDVICGVRCCWGLKILVILIKLNCSSIDLSCFIRVTSCFVANET